MECLVCGAMSESFEEHYLGETPKIINCQTCGKYSIQLENSPFDKHKTKSFLFYNKRTSNKIIVLRSEAILKSYIEPYKQDIIAQGRPLNNNFLEKSEKDIENWYPEQFKDKVDMILLELAKRNKIVGKPIILTAYEIVALLFLEVENAVEIDISIPKEKLDKYYLAENIAEIGQLQYYKDYFSKNNLLEICKYDDRFNPPDVLSFAITILPEGYKIIYDMQKNNTNSKDVFIAMAFAPEYDYIRDSIIQAIKATGYTEKIMSDYQTNNWIMPEIFHLIRQSRFVIVDLTSHNLGAYYESGFAEGIGKEVIHICNKTEFEKESHFDVKQKATVLWNNADELRERLIERIEATIGRAK